MNRRMKKFLAITLALVLIALVTTSGGNIMAAKKFRFAFVARAQGDSFAAWLTNSIKSEVAKYPDMEVSVFDGQSKNEVVNAAIENAVTNKFDGILLQPFDSEAQVAPMKAAMAAGLKCATVNMFVNDGGVISRVDADPYGQGAVPARVALQQVPKNSRVVVLLGPAGNRHTLERRRAWQKEFFEKRPDVKIIDEQIANWNKDEAMTKMEDWISATGGKIDAIVSMNDNMAVGALEAAKAAGIKKILAYGVDGTAEACLYIKEGKLTVTCLQSAYELAKLSVGLMHDLFTGKKKRADIMIPNILIDKSNVNQYLEMHRKAGNMQ